MWTIPKMSIDTFLIEPYTSLCGLLSIILATEIVVLLRKYRQLKNKEMLFEERYQSLKEQTKERNEKLYSTNNQLYEEIAKHEDTTALLLETRNYLQNIINSMPAILIGINRQGVVTHWNNAAQKETGIAYPMALGKSSQDVIDEPQISQRLIETSLDNQKPRYLEAVQNTQSQDASYRDITIYPLSNLEAESAVILIEDVTSRVQLENMIIQNEKMRSLGELAAGVAHEINNPLGTILQSTQNIQRRLSDTLAANQNIAKELGTELPTIVSYLEERKIISFIEHIKEAGERAAKIVTNMLEFSRTHAFQHEPVELVELLNRSIDLAISSSSLNQEYENITFTIERNFPVECPMIYGSAAELQQVVLNIINNAYQAYSDYYLNLAIADHTEEGNLTVMLDLSYDNQWAIMRISDNGPGMNKRTQRHLFEPFFTTKDVSKGTGLGLSVSYFIINEHHNGSITVESEEGKGTTFTIKLPLKNT